MENACIFILFFNYIFKPPCLNGKLYQINIEWASRNLLHNKKKIISHHGYQGNRKAENLNPIQQCSIGRQPSFSPKTTSQTKHPTSSSIHTGEQHYQPIINSVIKTKYPGIITTAPGLSLNSHFFIPPLNIFVVLVALCLSHRFQHRSRMWCSHLTCILAATLTLSNPSSAHTVNNNYLFLPCKTKHIILLF